MHAIEEQTLTEMTLDALWDLHERTLAILTSRLETEKTELDFRLRRLRGSDETSLATERSRRRYPPVAQKFCNPSAPHQTWSGRGKTPRWIEELLASGKSLEDLRIEKPREDGEKRWLTLKTTSTI